MPSFRINAPSMVRSGGKPKGLLVSFASLSTRRLRIAKLTVGDLNKLKKEHLWKC